MISPLQQSFNEGLTDGVVSFQEGGHNCPARPVAKSGGMIKFSGIISLRISMRSISREEQPLLWESNSMEVNYYGFVHDGMKGVFKFEVLMIIMTQYRFILGELSESCSLGQKGVSMRELDYWSHDLC